MKEKVEVTKCFQSCPFYSNSMDGMYCGHPFFRGKGYDAMIIYHIELEEDPIPSKCPLRKEGVTTIIELKKGRL